MEDEQRYLVWLHSIREMSDRHRRGLCAYFGSAREVFEKAKHADLLVALSAASQNTAHIAYAIEHAREATPPDLLMDMVEKTGCVVYAQDDDGYPPLLREIGDEAPFLLYAIGDYTPDQDKTIAIVGTRRNSRYGAEVAQGLAKDLAMAGVCVVSGMADGIDAYAHQGSLEGEGLTVAVLGCGVDVVYPSANSNLYQDICRHGAIISEFFPGTKPLAHHFPMRNRIISGMSQGVVVVECPQKSGAMITARLCVEQGRELFVVPGNITSSQATGSNTLLLSGASLILDAQDILNRFAWVPGFSHKAGEERDLGDLSEVDMRVCNALAGGALYLEELAKACGESVGDLISHLTLMEIRGIIKQLPGQLFALMER